MKEIEELEPQQYEQLYGEENIPVKDVRKNVLRKFIYIATVICIVFIIIGVFVKFSDQVELPFLLKKDQSEEIYRFSHPVYVIEKFVNIGDSIKKDQSLIKITSPEITEMINKYRDAEQMLLNFKENKNLSVAKQKSMIATEMQQNISRIADLENELTSLDNIWKNKNARLQYEYESADLKYSTNKKLYEDKVISKFDFLETEKNKLSAENMLNAEKQNYVREKERLAALIKDYRLNNNSLYTSSGKISVDVKYDSVSLSNQFILAKEKIENSFGSFEINSGNLILKSTESGIVSYLFDGEKEVASGAILLKIMYNDSKMYASVDCPPSMIGKIKKNQQVSLKIASLPFYEWGTAKGHIENLSLAPDEKGFFSVKIFIDDFRKLNNLTQAGMNGDAVIILEEKTFYDYFFRKAKKVYYESTMSSD